jgi:hypothetical protein
MTEQGRPTLTLRRKAEPEGQRAVNNSEPDGAGPGRVTRKKNSGGEHDACLEGQEAGGG